MEISEIQVSKEPKTEPPRRGKPLRDNIMLMVAVIVVAILLIIGIFLLGTGSEPEDEFSVSVDPDAVEIYAGETVQLTADAMFNDDLLEDWDNMSFVWTVCNSSVGEFLPHADGNSVLFRALANPGECVVTCNVTYVKGDSEFTAAAEVEVTILPTTLAEVQVDPVSITIVHDEVAIFNATAIDTLGAEISGIQVNWTVEGISSANYTLNSTSGASVSFSANATGTAWVNASASLRGVTETGTIVVTIIGGPPAMDITLITREQKLVVFNCTEPSSELSWGDILIQLTDGTDTISWSINTTGLDNGTLSVAPYGPSLLGADLIWMNITDNLGNGIVNANDTLSFATDGRFNPVKTYVVTIVYEPSMDAIASKNFQGA